MKGTETGERLRVMLVERHAFVRAAIRQTLAVPAIELVGEAVSAEETLELVPQLRPDVLLVDVDLPGMDGIELVRDLAPRVPATRIVMLTGSARIEDVVAAIRAGAVGYLTLDLSPEALVRALMGLREGDLAMPRRLAAQLVSQLVKPSTSRHMGGLSEREGQVLALVAEGMTDREVGRVLGISVRTVGRHVGSLLAKLSVRNRAEAARRYRAELSG